MDILEGLLEKIHQYKEHRYKVLLIIRGPMDNLFTPAILDEFADIANAMTINFQERYQGRLNEFFIWQDIRNELCEMANLQTTVVTDLEPLYAKWPVRERLSFLRNLLVSEPKYPLVFLLNCQEDLSDLKAITENNRGLIWAP